MTYHATADRLEALLCCELSGRQAAALLDHLESGCSGCLDLFGAAVAARLPEPAAGENPAPPDEQAERRELDEILGRTFAEARRHRKMLRRSRKDVAAAIDGLPGTGMTLEIYAAVTSGYAWSVCEACLALGREVRYRDPARMLAVVESATEIADQLKPEAFGRWAVADLQARAWAELGNARRVNDDLDGAEQAFATAEERRRQGSGNALLRAHIADLLASLRRHQRRFEEAHVLLARAGRLYRKGGDTHLAGKTLVNRGSVALGQSATKLAVSFFQRALTIVDRVRDPQLALSALHNLIHAQIDLGQYREARHEIFRQRGLYRQHAEPLILLRLRWLEGRIAAGLDEFGPAEREFLAARDGFAALGQGYDAALVGLDLTALYLRLGRIGDILPLLDQMKATFSSLRIGREALSLVVLMREALRRGLLTREMLADIAQTLQEIQPLVRS
jgi:tetratricopeptide (TPR) repeat protein